MCGSNTDPDSQHCIINVFSRMNTMQDLREMIPDAEAVLEEE